MNPQRCETVAQIRAQRPAPARDRVTRPQRAGRNLNVDLDLDLVMLERLVAIITLPIPCTVQSTVSAGQDASNTARVATSDDKDTMARLGHILPDGDKRFISDDDLRSFQAALCAHDSLPLVALNDWMPINQRVKKQPVATTSTATTSTTTSTATARKTPQRSRDETREGHLYFILKWPLLLFVAGWIFGLSVLYMLTRIYIALYEHFITWTGTREGLRRKLRETDSYEAWKQAARNLDHHLGNDRWKEKDEYAYYDYIIVNQITGQLRRLRARAEAEEKTSSDQLSKDAAIYELLTTVEGCVKSNFGGTENPKLYSETYIGTQHLVQEYINEVEAALQCLYKTHHLTSEEKYGLFSRLDRNLGRTALCLSGGATFAYYHFGVVKALLDTNSLPTIISGTSGGALVAALLCTRTNAELHQLLVPELAHKIKACQESFREWFGRWRRTGARFDAIDWAEKCSWFCRGSLTFKEAYERTGRVLNVTCVPSDPHSPTILLNYISSPDCVVWSAVLASAAVPGILNPVVLMLKKPDGSLAPYSFGNKWKDGSLRTDIPLNTLNTHFNVTFPIVSQVNPHISLFFFNPRGTVGRPVTHRKGRGWRGGFVGSAIEQYVKLDLVKWLKVLRHLELLPRPLGQDWSEVWLQRFGGVITIYPKTKTSDLYYILTDPTPKRLARMIREGQAATFPKILFIQNRMKVGRAIAKGLRLNKARKEEDRLPMRSELTANAEALRNMRALIQHAGDLTTYPDPPLDHSVESPYWERGNVLEELRRQSSIFFGFGANAGDLAGSDADFHQGQDP
ncbi:hypothetical protein KEM52_000279 [Ascosphaera acerosa]|nr:hypothetical protein KEM52_000279 [Ascosphaera acerosa]